MGNGLATIGETTALIRAIISTIIGLAFIIFGIILLFARSTDPNDSNKLIGSLLLVFGLLVIIISWLFYSLTKKSKTVAEISGGLDTAQFIGDTLHHL